LVQKPKTSIFTVMLAIALTALVLGCLFLYLEILEYGGFGAVKGPLTSLFPAGDAPLWAAIHATLALA
jgi:hypothetical protein